MKKTSSHIPFKAYTNSDPFSIPINSPVDKYRAIVENSIHAFFLTYPEGRILENNIAASHMFGYSAGEFKFLNRQDIIEHLENKLNPALPVRAKKGFTVFEATGIKKNGEHFPVEITSSIFTDSMGITKCSTMILDISMRKKGEAALQMSNERYNLVVKATKDLVWDWDLETGKIYRNNISLKYVYGHPDNNLLNSIENWSDYIHPLDKDHIKKQLDYYISSKEEKSFDFEYRFKNQDDQYVYIHDRGYIIRNEAGKAIRIIGAAENITERKKTVLAMEESERRYKIFVQQSTEGIWRIELPEPLHINLPVEQQIAYTYENAYIAECNDAFAKMYGYESAEKITGCPLYKILPNNNPANKGYLSKFFNNEFKVLEELSYDSDKEGNELIFINNMIGVVEGDYLIRAWGTQRNITDQKKAERNLLERENHLKAIVENDPECIKLLNKDGTILEMNPAGLRMIGAEHPNQVLGKKAEKLVAREYQQSFKKLVTDVFTGKTTKLEFEIIGFHKKRLFMETHAVPLRNAEGAIIAALSVTRDITDSKKAQADLLNSEIKYRYLFNNNPASIIIWDIDSLQIMEVNKAAVKLYGFSRKAFLKLTIADLKSKEFREQVLDSKNRKIRKTLQSETGTWQHITKDGTPVIMEITPHKITYKGKKAVFTIGNNITEKVQLENSLFEEREIKQQQITEAVITGQEQERTELGEELHDNINQILASTKLYIECALRDKNPRLDLLTESKSLIEKAMVEIRNLSKSLLPPSLGEIGLLQALHELVENFTQPNQLSFTIEWKVINENEINNKLKLTIFRIIQEQVNNVIKHACAKSVTISVEKTDRNIRLLISDDGRGFDTKLNRKGVGLRNISSRAEVNGGKISIISSPGNGCKLVVTFSVIKDQ